MARLARSLSALLVASALLLTGCSKSVEGESKAWTSNKAAADQLAVLYPAFSAPIKARIAEGEKAWAEAAGIADEKAKIEKMAEANKAVSGGFLGILKGLEQRTTKIRQNLVRVGGLTFDEADRMSAKAAIDDGNRILTGVDATLKAGAPDVNAATALLEKVKRDLDSVEKNLSTLEANFKRKQKAAANLPAQAPAAVPAAGAAAGATAAGAAAGAPAPAGAPAAAGTAAPAAAAAQAWKCEYCDATNEGTAKACKNCGAPHN
ncbi:MAG: hypothetical protein P1V51_24075 [Deltaproteobacteria bacterium]|nr:hypothetical protein [Deltaproteobacteria bacterium]